MAFDLNLDEDQRQILDAAAAMFATTYPVSRWRKNQRDDMSALAEFGLFGLALSQDDGGAGFSVVEEALVHTIAGRHLISATALGVAIAVRLAKQIGRDDLAGMAITGQQTACAAIPSKDGSLLLLDADSSDLALVFGDRSLALIDLREASAEAEPGLGHTVPLKRLHHASNATLGQSSDPELLNVADLLVSAQLLGIAEASRDLAVSYAKVREQFGRPIGSFQAVKHHCANMAIEAEMLSSMLDFAAVALRDGRDDASFQIAALRTLAARVALSNARTCVQVHGGIGFSAEADAHHYVKSAHILRNIGGAGDILDLPAALAPHEAAREHPES